jgi:hypothetical protein
LHYQTPEGVLKEDFLNRTFVNWFYKQRMAVQDFKLPQMNETFMQGGYYRVDLDNGLSLLSLNTLIFNINLRGEYEQPEEAMKQLDWLETNLN